MRDSRFNRIIVPQVAGDLSGPAAQPAIICTAGEKPLRVLVRNTSFALTAFFAFDPAALLALVTGAAGDMYELPAGASDEFILAPGQKLYVASDFALGTISIAISQALPPFVGGDKARANY